MWPGGPPSNASAWARVAPISRRAKFDRVMPGRDDHTAKWANIAQPRNTNAAIQVQRLLNMMPLRRQRVLCSLRVIRVTTTKSLGDGVEPRGNEERGTKNEESGTEWRRFSS